VLIGGDASPFPVALLNSEPHDPSTFPPQDNGTFYLLPFNDDDLTQQSSPTRKRTRDQTRHVPTSTPVPPSSPPDDNDDMAEVADEFEDDIDEVPDLEDADEEIDGEDLFGENMMR